MNTTAIEVAIAIVTFICSVGASAFVSGTRWGRIEATLTDLEKDRVRQVDVNTLNERLARIEGMFTLTFKDKNQ